jgi:hypothetical protein
MPPRRKAKANSLTRQLTVAKSTAKVAVVKAVGSTRAIQKSGKAAANKAAGEAAGNPAPVVAVGSGEAGQAFAGAGVPAPIPSDPPPGGTTAVMGPPPKPKTKVAAWGVPALVAAKPAGPPPAMPRSSYHYAKPAGPPPATPCGSCPYWYAKADAASRSGSLLPASSRPVSWTGGVPNTP